MRYPTRLRPGFYFLESKSSMFRKFRVVILLLILATVALGAWRANNRLTAWEHTIHVGIYPIAGDSSASTAQFIRDFNTDSVADIAEWMQEQTRNFEIAVLQPVSFQIAPRISEQPPLPPKNPSALDAAIWSMKIRWWAWKHDDISGPKPHIRLYVIFHDAQQNSQLAHSVGLGKGQIGLIHVFASRKQGRQNAVVITHELLHIFGASDKYDLSNLQPIFPQGYAEPEKTPRLPQTFAEIMAGRTPISETQAKIPASLTETVVGHETAVEIGWIKK